MIFLDTLCAPHSHGDGCYSVGTFPNAVGESGTTNYLLTRYKSHAFD